MDTTHTLKLVNGPCNGWVVLPADPVQMGIQREREDGKIEVGRAIYEPIWIDRAFWSHNEWDGILVDVVP